MLVAAFHLSITIGTDRFAGFEPPLVIQRFLHQVAVLGEVLEESGVHATIVDQAGTSTFHFYSYLDRAVHRKIVYWFEMETADTVVSVNRELQGGAFVPPADALRLLSFANDVGNLKAVLERRAGHVRSGSER